MVDYVRIFKVGVLEFGFDAMMNIKVILDSSCRSKHDIFVSYEI